MQIGVLEPSDFSMDAVVELNKIGTVSFYDKTESAIASFVSDKEILFIRLAHLMNKDLLDDAKKLKVICTPTTGLNHLDLNYLNGRGIKIISLKGDSEFLKTIRATPEHTFGLALSLIRNYKDIYQKCSIMNWDRDLYKGYELYNMSVGIIGVGRVGKLLIKYLNAFDAKVCCFDKLPAATSGIENVSVLNSIDEVIVNADLVFICASFDYQLPIIDRYQMLLLKNKYLINTARGELINEEELIKALQENWFKGVALDVISNENGNNNLEKFLHLAGNRNLIITPHIGGATYTSMWKTELRMIQLLKTHLLG